MTLIHRLILPFNQALGFNKNKVKSTNRRLVDYNPTPLRVHSFGAILVILIPV